MNPLRKLESLNQIESTRHSGLSLFNDQSETDYKNLSSNRGESNQNILKLAEDTLNFIDQELTKSYKLTNVETIHNRSPTKIEESKNQFTDSISKFKYIHSLFFGYCFNIFHDDCKVIKSF